MKLFIVFLTFLIVLVSNLCYGLECYKCGSDVGRANPTNVTCDQENAVVQQCTGNGKKYCKTVELRDKMSQPVSKEIVRACSDSRATELAVKAYDKTFSGTGCYDWEGTQEGATLCFCETDKCNDNNALSQPKKSLSDVLQGSWIIIITSSLTTLVIMNQCSVSP